MAVSRTCSARTERGEPCRQAPLQGGHLCFWHDPATAAEAAEARRLGGLRRRRERTVAGAYDLDGLASVPGIRRLLEIAVSDTLGLENSVARSRTLASLAGIALRLLETGELESRLGALESAVQGQRLPAPSLFDSEPVDGEVIFESEER